MLLEALHLAVSPQCSQLVGQAAQQACVQTGQLLSSNNVTPNVAPGTAGGGATTGVNAVNLATDPLGSIAQSCANAAIWVLQHLDSAIHSTTTVDFTNAGFLKQYAIVFAAATVLTLLLWMLAVIKRAVRGEGIATAIGEATGLLWVAFLASAFTPMLLAGVVTFTDSITNAISNTQGAQTNSFLSAYANALQPKSGLGGGSVMLIFVSLLSLVAAAALWLELFVRAALLYVGAGMAAIVYSGLVDRALWNHARRWIGMMFAVDLIKPIIVIVLMLATAVSSGSKDPMSAVLSGLAILFLSIFSSTLIYRFVPAFGDDIIAGSSSRQAARDAAGAVAAVSSPAARVREGIAAHADRDTSAGGAGGGRGGGLPSPSAAVAMGAGMVAHGARTAASRLQPVRDQPTPPPPPPPAGLPTSGPPPTSGNRPQLGSGDAT